VHQQLVSRIGESWLTRLRDALDAS
jgi:hypothetical protein